MSRDRAPAAATTPREVTLVVDGREARVAAGVTVAAALLSSGISTFRRSATGEGRGPLCGMGICHECRVTIDGVEQRRACLIGVVEGMRVETEWGARTDGARGSGLGTRDPLGRVTRSVRRHAIPESRAPSPVAAPDLLVIGAGPAGIAAATVAAELGRAVVLVDESPQVGGQIWRHRAGEREALTRDARRWIERLERSGATVLRGASVVDVRDDDAGSGGGFVVVGERDDVPFVLRARSVVLATGARERFLPFPGWTLPGVVGVGAAQALLKSGAPFGGRRVVVAGSGPLLLPVAASLASHGARVLRVAEQAPRRAVARFALGLWREPATLLQAARYRARFARTTYRTGEWVTAARGDGRLEEADVTDGRATRTIACDVLCVAHGLVPSTELARLIGCATADGGAVLVDERQATSRPGVFCAGEPTGVGGVELALVEGEIAGRCAAAAGDDASPPGALRARRARLRSAALAMERAFAPRAELRALAAPDTVVCRCEDVPLGAIRREWTPRQAKLYTRAGMGPCQGRVCGAALQCLFDWGDDAVRLPAAPALLRTLIADESGAPAASVAAAGDTTTTTTTTTTAASTIDRGA